MTGKDVLLKKYLLLKAATLKRFQHLPLGKKSRAQTDTAKKQYQKLGDTYELDKIIKKENPKLKKHNKSNLIYGSSYNFFKYYRDIKKFGNLSFKSVYSYLISFFNNLNKFNKLKLQKEEIKEKKSKCV